MVKPADTSRDLSLIMMNNVVLEILNPGSDKPLGLTVEIRSASSPEVRAVQRSITNRSLKLAKRGKLFTAEEVEENTYDQLCAAIVNWTWHDGATWAGETPSFDPKIAKTIFRKLPFVSSQIDDKLGEDAAFFKV